MTEQQPSEPTATRIQQLGTCYPISTREIARRILALIDHGLTPGKGQPIPGCMCLQAAVVHGLGLPHGDNPPGVFRALKDLNLRLNDLGWSSPLARARGLRRLGIVQLDSANVVDEGDFAGRIATLAAQKYLLLALRAAASIQSDCGLKVALEAAARTCEIEPSSSSCEAAIEVLAEAQGIYHGPIAAQVCLAARLAAEHSFKALFLPASFVPESEADRSDDEPELNSAVEITIAAGYAAMKSARCAGLVAGKGAESEAHDRTIAAFAEDVVQILVSLNAPGCQWLDMTTAHS